MNSIFLISGTITFSHSIGEKNEALVPVFYADWTSVPVPRTSSLRGLDVGFIPLLPKGLPYMANNDEYTDEYNDEYLCRDFFVGFNFWSRSLSKSRYYKEGQVDRKKCQAIRW